MNFRILFSNQLCHFDRCPYNLFIPSCLTSFVASISSCLPSEKNTCHPIIHLSNGGYSDCNALLFDLLSSFVCRNAMGNLLLKQSMRATSNEAYLLLASEVPSTRDLYHNQHLMTSSRTQNVTLSIQEMLRSACTSELQRKPPFQPPFWMSPPRTQTAPSCLERKRKIKT